MLSIITGIAVVIIVLFLLNRSALRKLFAAGSAGAGKVAHAAWAVDPIAVYKDQIEKLSSELRAASDALVVHQGLIRTLKQNYEADQAEYFKIEAKIKLAIQDTKNEEAERLAVMLSTVKDRLDKTTTSIQNAEHAYQVQLANIKKLKEKILELKEKGKNYAADLQISKVERNVADLTEKFNTNSINFDDLGEIEGEIQKQINENKSKVQVSQDLNGTIGPDDSEIARKAKADDLLKSIKDSMQK